MKHPTSILISDSPEKTKAIGKTFARSLEAGKCIGLIGELGAGKTQFVKGLARNLGIDENEVVSPSFGLINEYEGDKKLYHVDLYRLESDLDIETLGLTDYFQSNGICVIEWADRLGDEIAFLDAVIEIEILSDNRRRFVFYENNITASDEKAQTL
jgi:tRNA threonylcarbamoyladenosine biosynthesis protein TsaE